MSEDKLKTATEQALDDAKAQLKERLEQINALKEELKTSKYLLEKTEKDLKTVDAMIEKVGKWASDFGANPEANYKGSFIDSEMQKVLKEKNENKNL